MKSPKSVVPVKSVSFTKAVTGRRTFTSQFKREAVELVEREGVSVAQNGSGRNQSSDCIGRFEFVPEMNTTSRPVSG